MRLLLVISVLLAGCSSDKLECKPATGVGCAPLSHVNRLIDEGRLELETTGSQPQEKIYYVE